MRGILNKIFKLLNINGRDWVVLLLSLLLAFSVWMIHKLSLEYSVYITVNVEAYSNIEGHSDCSTTPSEVMAKCRTTGWQALYAHMTRNRKVEVTFPASIMVHEEDDRYYISAEKLHEYVEPIFGSNVSVEYFVSDRVYFRFQDETHKRVPVRPVYSFIYEDQYVANGNLVITPDSVTVYGDKFHLESIDHVKTSMIRQTDISGDINGIISLEPISGMRLSADEVHYSMNVVRYVEIKAESVPVKVINAPRDRAYQTDPATVDVIMDCEFPLKADPKKGIMLVVDYNDFQSSITGHAKVTSTSLPEGVINCEVIPIAVKLREVRK